MISIWQTQTDVEAWIKSCENEVQITTCVSVVNNFFTTKIYNVPELQINLIKAELQAIINTQRLLIASGTTKAKTQRFPATDEQKPQIISQ